MKKTLLELLKAELLGELPPEGWYTMVELIEKLNAKRAVIEGAAERKKWERKKYRTMTKNGRVIVAVHYHTGKL